MPSDAAALSADGLNNFTDVISTVAVMIGLRIARRPADEDKSLWPLESGNDSEPRHFLNHAFGRPAGTVLKFFETHRRRVHHS